MAASLGPGSLQSTSLRHVAASAPFALCSKQQRSRPHFRGLKVRSADDQAAGNSAGNAGEASAEESMADKLAKAEAEAEALRRELALRKGEPDPKKNVYIDGVGYRETIFSGLKTRGKLGGKDGSAAWGFTETELLQSEGGLAKLQQEYGTDQNDKVVTADEAQAIVTKRLLIGGALSVGALALSLIELPVTVSTPRKPLSVYLVPILRLQESLATVQEQAEFLDALGLRSQLKLATGSMSSVRDNLLNATALLDGTIQGAARPLAFDVLDYLEQADYSKYFEGIGVPGPYQQAEYIKFSLQSLEVAQKKLAAFLALMPYEPLAVARGQLEARGSIE